MEWIALQHRLQRQRPQQELLVQIGQRSRIKFYSSFFLSNNLTNNELIFQGQEWCL